ETVQGWDLGPNTAIGSHTLENNVDGSANTAIGYNALVSQIHGGALGQLPQLGGNTAVGFKALANVTGLMGADNALNTALGYHALFDLTNGRVNTAVGALAGEGLTTGVGNVNVGIEAGFGNVTGSGNIFIGDLQGPATSGETGHTYIGNIRSTSLPVGGSIDVVTIDTSSGLLGHNSSSRRYKHDIKPLDTASETLYRLKPVSYHLQKETDRNRSRAFGLIAEEVAEVNPDLIVRNAQGEIEGVHYEMVNTMLLNEFLKEHHIVQELKSIVVKQEIVAAQQQKQIEALTAGLQKVSAQLELSKAAQQAV